MQCKKGKKHPPSEWAMRCDVVKEIDGPGPGARLKWWRPVTWCRGVLGEMLGKFGRPSPHLRVHSMQTKRVFETGEAPNHYNNRHWPRMFCRGHLSPMPFQYPRLPS